MAAPCAAVRVGRSQHALMAADASVRATNWSSRLAAASRTSPSAAQPSTPSMLRSIARSVAKPSSASSTTPMHDASATPRADLRTKAAP